MAAARAQSSIGSVSDDGHRLPGADPEQRRPRIEPRASARARALAAALSRLVARAGPDRLPGRGRLSPHRRLGGPGWLGLVRLREDAGVSLGHLSGRARRGPDDWLRRRVWQAGLA